jgi:hypothetical protein
MPMTRLAGRMIREEQRVNGENQKWITELWVQGRALYHALTANQDMPPTKAETEGKKKPDWGAINHARKWRKEHDGEWHEALSSPKYFGAFIGMPQIFGEPEKSVKTAKEIQQKEREQLKEGWENFVEAFGESMDRMAETQGNRPLF